MNTLLPIINKERDDVLILILENIRQVISEKAFVDMENVPYSEFSVILEKIILNCGKDS